MFTVFKVSLLLLLTVPVLAQHQGPDLSIRLGYPIPVGDNFINKGTGTGYNGIAAIGIDYTILRVKNFNFGALLDASFYRYKVADVSLRVISPKVNAGYSISINRVEVQPQIAVGYAHFRFKETASSASEADVNVGGFTVNARTKVVLPSKKKVKIFFSVAYDFTRIGKLTASSRDISFNRNMQFLTPEVGLSWKFGPL